MDALKIYNDVLTDDELDAITEKYTKWPFSAYAKECNELLAALPERLYPRAQDVIYSARCSGEVNGFCAGFYYALRMQPKLQTAAAAYWTDASKEEAER